VSCCRFQRHLVKLDGFFQLGALGGETDFSEASKVEAEDGRGVFLGLEVRVGSELVGSGPEGIWCINGAAASVDLVEDLTLSLTQCPLPLLF
jgi:hypothetical protein